MEALSAPLQRVVEASEWFVRTPALRLLHIATSDVLRLAVLEHLVATELLDVNGCPFFVLEAPMEIEDDGWTLRSDELRADWSELVAAADLSLDPLWPDVGASTPLERFCLELQLALQSRHASMAGLVIVLAPVWIRDGDRWWRDLSTLLGFMQLRDARFVIVECGQFEARTLTEQLGWTAEFVDARVDMELLRKEMRARLEAMSTPPPGATGPRLTGAAGPSIAPPQREGAPAPDPERLALEAEQLGISPVLLDANAMHELRLAVLRGALAMADGDTELALAAQLRARDFCHDHGLEREAVVNQLVLAGYALQAGDLEQADRAFEAAGIRADAAGLSELAVLARFAVGSTQVVRNRIEQAILAYDDVGRRGAALGLLDLAREAVRMRDELLRRAGARAPEST